MKTEVIMIVCFWMVFFNAVMGMILGGAVVQIYHDNLWGDWNHKSGRKWGWRPYWKNDFER